MIEYTIIQYFLIIFAFFLIIIGYSFLFSFIFQAPPIPSTIKVHQKISDIIEKEDQNGKNIVDLGSGYGHMVFYLAKRFPNKKIIGLEISLIPYLYSYLKKFIFKYKNVSFLLGDGFHIIKTGKIKPSSVVFYLTPILVKKISNILPLIKVIAISNNFPIPNIKENQKIPIDDWTKSIIYLYKS